MAAMKKSKRKRLESAGWSVGTAAEFLGLSDEEALLIEVKLALAQSLRKRRLAQDLTQVELARLLGSSQSRVARMEAADPEVSVDLLVRALAALGVTRRDLAKYIGARVARPAA
jgi:DNA-binding XRE family transcriptional regulator